MLIAGEGKTSSQFSLNCPNSLCLNFLTGPYQTLPLSSSYSCGHFHPNKVARCPKFPPRWHIDIYLQDKRFMKMSLSKLVYYTETVNILLNPTLDFKVCGRYGIILQLELPVCHHGLLAYFLSVFLSTPPIWGTRN